MLDFQSHTDLLKNTLQSAWKNDLDENLPVVDSTSGNGYCFLLSSTVQAVMALSLAIPGGKCDT